MKGLEAVQLRKMKKLSMQRPPHLRFRHVVHDNLRRHLRRRVHRRRVKECQARVSSDGLFGYRLVAIRKTRWEMGAACCGSSHECFFFGREKS